MRIPLPRLDHRTWSTGSPIFVLGSKGNLADWIISQFPPHHAYVEPFGGSASVLLAKPWSKVEVYNDIDADVVNFFQVMRDRLPELAAKVAFTPHSRQLYEDTLTKWRQGKIPTDPVARAWEWQYLQVESLGGRFGSGWAHNVRGSSTAWRLFRAMERVTWASERMRQVELECRDFREVVKTYDSPETLFYVDPPYVDMPREYYRGHILGYQDHVDLALLLTSVQGKVVLSYYQHPIVEKFYGKWRRLAKMVPVMAEGVTKANPVETRGSAEELLLMNFPSTQALL